jgi:serine/threonine-protein kinase
VNWRGAVRRLLPYVIAIVGGFLLSYMYAAFVLFPSGVIPQDIKIPNVIGLDIETAMQRLEQAGLHGQRGETRFHASAPKNTVLEQTPPAGSRDVVGSNVTLAVSGGQRMAIIPNIVGMLRPEAERALDQAGFDAGDVTEAANDAPRGEVIDSRPKPGSLMPTPGPVALVLSSGPNVIEVPDVVGRKFNDARQLLEQLGFSVSDPTTENGDKGDKGALVMSQSPAGGSRVTGGSRITLRVAGP